MSPLPSGPKKCSQRQTSRIPEKLVFSCQTASEVPQPLDLLVFDRKQAPDAHAAFDFRFLPRKAGKFHPAELVTVVTAELVTVVTSSSPLSFGLKKCAKSANFPTSRGLRSSHDSPFFAQARQPAEVLTPAPTTCRTCHRLRHRV